MIQRGIGMFISKSLLNVGMVCYLAVFLVAGCGDKSEDKELTARIAAQLEAQKTPEQRALDAERAQEELKKEQLLDRMVRTARFVRDNAKNPKSFDLVSIIYIEKTDTVCMKYRATNSFNAVVTEYLAAGPAGKEVDWSKNCSGHLGADAVARVRAKL